jgi:HD-like signal output (HDOD) protein
MERMAGSINMQDHSSLLEKLRKPLESGKIQLPPFSATAMKIQQEAARRNPDTDLIEKLIMSDQALTTKILRMANSSYYQGLSEIKTVRNAIVRLGTQEVSKITMMVTQRGRYKARDKVIDRQMRELWKHSVGCAVASDWICRKIGFDQPLQEVVFAGLLHDVGKLFMLTMLDRIKLTYEEPVPFSEAFILELVNGSLHVLYGYELLHKWNLPETYCDITRNHHSEVLDRDDTPLLTVQLGNKACNSLGIGLREPPPIALKDTEQFHLLGLAEADMVELKKKLSDSKVLAG